MDTPNFLDIKERFEMQLKGIFKFELVELQFTPYAFGSGMSAYRINGRNVRIIYDGRDNSIEFMVSSNHVKYDKADWKTIYTGIQEDFVENGIVKLHELM